MNDTLQRQRRSALRARNRPRGGKRTGSEPALGGRRVRLTTVCLPAQKPNHIKGPGDVRVAARMRVQRAFETPQATPFEEFIDHLSRDHPSPTPTPGRMNPARSGASHSSERCDLRAGCLVKRIAPAASEPTERGLPPSDQRYVATGSLQWKARLVTVRRRGSRVRQNIQPDSQGDPRLRAWKGGVER